ncbi:MAG: glycosyltransferase family 2 protein [Methanobrevibacter sp.]|jgi:glycosyltransferase involved in cell wall biosynthesis|nr:glycosyltransferase family 2 protein [Methanobrevibacter sp.]
MNIIENEDKSISVTESIGKNREKMQIINPMDETCSTKTKTPLVSVIMPTYNGENTIKIAIESVITQSLGLENIELVIVDDNSNDKTQNILKEFSKKYENIKSIFLKKNSGTASKPRNIGIEYAKADHIMFLDQDDEYAPDICDKLYSTLVLNSADCVCCRYEQIFDYKSKKYRHILDKFKNTININSIEEFPALMSLGFPTMIWTKIYKKSIMIENNIKFPEKDLYEDVYFSSIYYLKSKNIIILNDYYGYIYKIMTKNISKSGSTSQKFTKSLVNKQFNGFLKIMNEFENNDNYPFIAELTVDMTKIYLNTNLDINFQKYFLSKIKKYYKRYNITTRINAVSIPFNLTINIFIKLFSISIIFPIFVSKLYKFIKNI